MWIRAADVPRTDVVLADPRLAAARERLGGTLVKAAVAQAQELARAGAISPAGVADAAAAALPPTAATLAPVINATGVIVHTNLGRAPLSAAARAAVRAAAGCTDVEFDLASGKRGRRGAGALDALARGGPGGRGGARGQQQRRRAGPGGHRPGRGTLRDHRQPRRADRDR